MPRGAKRWATSLIAAGLLLATGGCGEEPTPDTAAPQLATVLSRVDDAIAARNWDRGRRAVQRLIGETGAALDAGAITPEQADRIQAAAARLLSEIPDPPPQAPPPPSKDPEGTSDETEDFEEPEEPEDDAEDRREEAEEDDDEEDD